MIRTLFTLVVILGVVLCAHHARAQQNSSLADNAQTKDAALREKAFNLLEAAAGQVNTLQSPENRARLGANIADSLWNHDEKRARALFALVQDDIKAGLANRDLNDPQDRHTLKVFLKLRVDSVERIAKYDAELALAFLKATEFISDEPLPKDLTESERSLELRLARQMADNNPDLAVKLASQSLAQGVSEDLLVVLRRLNKKDKERALTLYKEIVKKLSDVNLARDWNARNFAQQLTYTFRPSDNSAFREFIGMLITRALAHGCGNNLTEDHDTNFCYWVASLLPQLEKMDPRAAQLKRWVREDMNMNVPPEAVHEFHDAMEAGNVNDLLAFAARYPDIAELVYTQVIRKARIEGDFELARKLVTDHIADPGRKREMLSDINHFEELTSVDDKKLAGLQSRLNQLRRPAERIQFLLEFANQVSGSNRNTVLKILKQAAEMADAMKPGKEQTHAQLRVALMYCLAKDDRGFAIMESLLPKLNELVDAAVKLDGYETGYLRDGEWNMSANGSVGDMLTTLSQHAAYFAWCDFDRAVSLAAQFDRSEIRLMAQVKLAQAILAGPPQRVRVQPFYGQTY